MTTNRKFSLALDALVELKTEQSAHQPTPIPATPSLYRVLSEIGSLPREALFLGMAIDGLPVLLNLFDPHPGAVLVTSDNGGGKTLFLQTIAHAISQTHHFEDVQFAVITPHVEEWETLPATKHKVGVFSTQHTDASNILLSLASWAHSNRSRQVVMLLVDDLESMAKMEAEAVNHFRWLLLRGPSRRVWPIVTMNAARYGQVLAWIPTFRTRIFGPIEKAQVAAALGCDLASESERLEMGHQFSLRENGDWLRFWVPDLGG